MRILWVPHATWRVPQRAHVLCHALAARHEIHVTDLVSDIASPRDYFSSRLVRTLLPTTWSDGVIRVHGIPRISPSLPFRRVRALNRRLARVAVDRLVRELDPDVVVGTFVAEPPHARRLAFDLFDDNVSRWRASRPEYAAEIAAVEDAYLRRADVVLAASRVLCERAAAAGANDVRWIPNAVDLAAVAAADGSDVRSRLVRHERLVGSVGNHDDPAELELLLSTAGLLRPHGVRLLIAGRGAAVRRLRGRPHDVLVLEDVALTQAADVVAALDVGLVPYRGTSMDEARSPMRLLLYAAVGVPAVCTELAEVRALGFSNVVLASPTPEAFAAAVLRALDLPRGRPAGIERFDVPVVAADVEAALAGDARRD